MTIELTKQQLIDLVYVLGNSSDHPDVMDALFPDKRERKIAESAVAN